jgi:hypothetical protein
MSTSYEVISAWATAVSAAFSTIAAFLAFWTIRHSRSQTNVAACAARSAVLTTIFTDILTDEMKIIRDVLLYDKGTLKIARDAAVKELLIAFNRAALLLKDDKELKGLFLEYRFRPELSEFVRERPNFGFALREMYAWARGNHRL